MTFVIAKKRVWAALAGLWLTAAPLWADTVTLKDEVYVKGPTVRLGDVASVEGPDAEYLKALEIGPSATPGGARRIDASLVESKLRQAGFEETDVEVRGSGRITAKTMHLDITQGMIAEELRQYILREMPWDPEPTEIEIVPTARNYTVSDGVVEFTWSANPQYDFLGLGTFRGEVLVDGVVEATVYAKANIESYDRVLVASRAVSRGETLSEANTRFEMQPLSTIRQGAFFSLADLDGYVAKSSIFQGQVVTPRKVEAQTIVKRGQVIPVETVIGSLTVRAVGEAMSNAAAGDRLVCRNPASKEEFIGVLRKDGTLIVE